MKFNMEVVSLENDKDKYDLVLRVLRERVDGMKSRNPRGWLDAFEQSWENICIEIAAAVGAAVKFWKEPNGKDVVQFDFSQRG